MRRLAALARREAGRSALAALGGVALAFAFPPYGLWPLSLLAVAALSLLTRGRTGRQGAWLGFAFGWPFFIVLLKWLHVVGWDAVIGLAFLQSLFVLGLGAGLAVTARLPLWPLWGACLWLTEEFLRDRLPFGGFSWGRLAFANTDSPYTPLAALGGAPLVSFAAALTGTLLAAAALRGLRLRSAAARTGRAYATCAGALVLAGAATVAGLAVPVPTKAADTVRVAVVQGNVQQPGMHFLGRPMQILNNHAEATLDLAKRIEQGKEPRPDLVIWPENSSDLDPYKYPEAGDRIDRAVKAVGVPVLVGALVDHPTKEGYVENQGIVWDPEKGPGASYTKQHPVPFGEYVPFRDQLSKVITRLQQVPRDFYPGDHTGVLQTGPARLGDVICFEVAYDEIPRDTVKDGAARARRPDQQRHLRPDRAARAAAGDVQAACRRARPCRGHRGDQRHQRHRRARRHRPAAYGGVHPGRAHRGAPAARRDHPRRPRRCCSRMGDRYRGRARLRRGVDPGPQTERHRCPDPVPRRTRPVPGTAPTGRTDRLKRRGSTSDGRRTTAVRPAGNGPGHHPDLRRGRQHPARRLPGARGGARGARPRRGRQQPRRHREDRRRAGGRGRPRPRPAPQGQGRTRRGLSGGLPLGHRQRLRRPDRDGRGRLPPARGLPPGC